MPLTGKIPIKIAAQNAHWQNKGAYTGEVSLEMLGDIGIDTVIIGHSERRQFFNESNDSIAKKVKACLQHDFTPILCIGESLAERKDEETQEVLREQLNTVFKELKQPGKLIIAYEPVWAIGTGLAATAEEAQNMHHFIRGLLAEKFGQEQAERISLLYGGSMKVENTKTLLSQPDIDGGLIGGASLDPLAFAQMLAIAAQLLRASS